MKINKSRFNQSYENKLPSPHEKVINTNEKHFISVRKDLYIYETEYTKPQHFVNNTTNGNVTGLVPNSTFPPKRNLCGFPAFCSEKAAETCLNTTLSECDECNMAEAGFLATLYIVIGCIVISGNGIVLWNVVTKRKGFDDTYSKIRASLAVADIMSGFQIFSVILANFGWTVGSTSYEIDMAEAAFKGSTKAIVGGMFYLLGLTASLYHLLFLSSQRLYAIALPVRYKVRSKFSLYFGLVLVWFLAVLSATYPVWFPSKIDFTYNHILFLYYPTTKGNLFSSTTRIEALALSTLVCLFFVPYFLMTALSLASGAMIHRYYQHRAKNLTASHFSKKFPKKVSKHEIHVLKTVVVMQVGFTITLLPLATAITMFYARSLTCANFSTPYFICFYLSLCHSFVNILVYAALSPKFRKSIKAALCACLPRRFKKKATNMAMKEKNSNNLSTSQTRSTDLTKSIANKNTSIRHLPGMPSVRKQRAQHKT